MSTHDSQPYGHLTVFDDAQFHVRGGTLLFVVLIFTVVFLIAIVLLYARWVCQYHNHPRSSHAPHAPPCNQPKGLDPAVMRALPMELFQKSDRDLEAGDGGECCICLGVFEDGEKVKVLPICRHCYHSECVDTWLATHSSCPLCRSELPPH